MDRSAGARGVVAWFRVPAFGGVVAIALFEVLLRVVHVDEEVAALCLGLTVLPALVVGLARRVAALAGDPRRHAAAVALAFGDVALAICFFAFLYLELGIYSPADPTRDVTSYLTCLYFSASTLTNAGLGDFLPRPETRFVAAVEMLFGYLALGIVTAATFSLLVRRERPKDDPPRS
jgi:hypothetical protein